MSELKKTISDARIAALKAKDKAKDTISSILAEIKKKEVDDRKELNDSEVLAILTKMVKQRKESIDQFVAGNRDDLAETERQEISVIETFLPQKASAQEIIDVITKAIAATSAASIKDMGKVMALVKGELTGKADMGEVSKIIKERLS